MRVHVCHLPLICPSHKSMYRYNNWLEGITIRAGIWGAGPTLVIDKRKECDTEIWENAHNSETVTGTTHLKGGRMGMHCITIIIQAKLPNGEVWPFHYLRDSFIRNFTPRYKENPDILSPMNFNSMLLGKPGCPYQEIWFSEPHIRKAPVPLSGDRWFDIRETLTKYQEIPDSTSGKSRL